MPSTSKSSVSASFSVAYKTQSAGKIVLDKVTSEGETNSPKQLVALYCREPCFVRISAGAYEKDKDDYSESKEEFLSFTNSKSQQLANPKSSSVTMEKLGTFYDAKGVEVSATLSYDYDSNSVKSDRPFTGAVKVNYTVTGVTYKINLENATLADKKRFAFFMAFTEPKRPDGSVIDPEQETMELSYTSAESNAIIVEEHTPEGTAADPPTLPWIKFVDVFCDTPTPAGAEENHSVALTSGTYEKMGDFLKKGKDLVVLDGGSVSAGVPSMKTFSMTQIGNAFDQKGNTYSSFSYDGDRRVIVPADPGHYYGAFYISYEAEATRYRVNLLEATITEAPKREAVFFGSTVRDGEYLSGNATLSWIPTDATIKEAGDKDKKSDVLRLKIETWERTRTILQTKLKRALFFFYVIPSPDKGIKFFSVSPDLLGIGSVSWLRGGTTANSSGGTTTTPESVFVGAASKKEFGEQEIISRSVKIEVTDPLNFSNNNDSPISYKPIVNDPGAGAGGGMTATGKWEVSLGPAIDVFGNTIEVSLAKPGDKIIKATWEAVQDIAGSGGHLQLKQVESKLIFNGVETIMFSSGPEETLGEKEVAIVDSFKRTIPVFCSGQVTYEVRMSIFCAYMKMLPDVMIRGTDPTKWFDAARIYAVGKVSTSNAFKDQTCTGDWEVKGNLGTQGSQTSKQDVIVS